MRTVFLESVFLLSWSRNSLLWNKDLKWASTVLFTPLNRISQVSVLILSSHLLLGIGRHICLNTYPTKIVHAFYPHLFMFQIFNFSWLNSHNNIQLRVQRWSVSLCNHVHPHVIFSFLGTSFFNRLFWRTLDLRSSFRLTGQLVVRSSSSGSRKEWEVGV
jgi:hypothetical protein